VSLAGLVVGGGAALAVALLITLAVGRQRFRARVSREIHMMVAGARSLGADELAARWDGLPEPVRCHLRHAIPPGAPALRSARLLHHGTFRPSRLRRWFPIRGEEYFTVEPPGFVWHATLRMMPGLWFEARDHLLDQRGSMLVKLASTLAVVDASGPAIDQGAAMRWLAEAVWFPRALLSDRIAWEPVDERSARARLRWRRDPGRPGLHARRRRHVRKPARRARARGRRPPAPVERHAGRLPRIRRLPRAHERRGGLGVRRP
jgi:hypothetical protein